MAESLGKFTFGKHKGEDIEGVPTHYLEWIKGEDWFKEKYQSLHANIMKELKYRERFGDPK